MKKLLSIFMLGLAVFGMTSCSSADNAVIEIPLPVEEPALATIIAGTYNGWTNASATYFSGMIGENDNVEITANADGTINVIYTSKTWGTATINNVLVAEKDGQYTVAGAEGVIAMASHSGEVKEYAVLLNGGTISKDLKTYAFEFNAPSVMGGTTMAFAAGEAPAALLAAGSYEGWTSAACAYFADMNNDGDKVTVKANEDGTVNITYTAKTWGEATFEHVAVTKTEAGFEFKAETESTILMPGMNGGEAKEYAAILLSGELSADGKTYKFVFSAPAVMGGTTMTFQNGTAPAEEEAEEGDGEEQGENEGGK